MNILYLSPWFPYPQDNGAKLRISNLLRALSKQHRITLIAAYDPSSKASLAELESICERVEPIPWRPHPMRGMNRFLSYVKPDPERALFEPSPGMRQVIAREARSGRYDLIVAFQLGAAVYFRDFGDVPALLEELELGAYRSTFSSDKPIVRQWRGHVFWWKFQRVIRNLLGWFSACTVASEPEQQLLRTVAPHFGPVEIIPNCLDCRSYRAIHATPEPSTLIFSGSLTFPANYEAIVFFLREIYPLIKLRLPDVRLRITGRHNNLPLPVEPSDPCVTLTGFVDDVRPLIASSYVSVVPLLTGGGTRLKILEAMALGTPVVSTAKGAEGLAVEDGRHLLIADQPEDFAAAIVRICQDADLRTRLVEQARCLVTERYDWSAVAPRFLEFVEQVARQSSLGQGPSHTTAYQ